MVVTTARRTGAATAVVLATLLWMAAPASASADHVVADWNFAEPAGATQLRDVGRHGLHGRIGRDVETGIREPGASAHRFSFVLPDAPPANPERINTVPHDNRLNPRSGSFSVTVRLRTTSQEGGNIVQKGQSGVPGGFWKMDIENRTVYCLFRGPEGSRGVWAVRRIDDGIWHTVRCERTASGVTMWIDGELQSRNSGHTGPIGNDRVLSIAGKTSCNQLSVGCDYFSGDIARITIRDDVVVK